MPKHRFRQRFLDRLLHDVKSAGELGLAFFLTAGVAACGGETTPGVGTQDASSKDGAANPDTGPAIEAAQFEGGVVEAAQRDGGPQPEAAQFEGGVVEAAQFDGGEAGLGEAGLGETGVVTEAAQFDAGDAQPVMEGVSTLDSGH